MSEHPILTVDPWPNKNIDASRIPPESTFLCAYGVYLGIDTVDEAAFFRRTADRDELWVAMDLHPAILVSLANPTAPIEIDRFQTLVLGRTVVARRASDVRSASRALLDALFRARVGFGSPNGLTLSGAIDADTFLRLTLAIERELEENAREAKRGRAEIIVAARELGLSPDPTGAGSHQWRATCPGTNHGLAIDSATNEFGCGYCRRKGGPEELRAFAEERRARRSLRSRA